MKIWKKAVSILLAVALSVSCLMLPTQATEGTIVASGYCGGEGDGTNLTWELTEDGVLTISGTGEMAYGYRGGPWCDSYQEAITSVIIGSGVTSIGGEAFYRCSNLNSVTIPDSVTSIGNGAFYSCSSLSSITIPDGITSISEELFAWCESLAEIEIPANVTSIGNRAFTGSGLTNISIPSGVTSVGEDAFSDCNSLTSVTIPGNVISISDGMFVRCGNLASVTIEEGVTAIMDSAFGQCRELASITIPASVTSIGDYVFDCCSNLTGIWVDENNAHYCSDDKGVLFNKEKTELIAAPGAMSGSYDVPESVVSIRNNAFGWCALTSVTIPEGITSIGDNVFQYCDLTDITLPDSIASIGVRAFFGCYQLTCVNIPEAVTEIGGVAFAYCDKLTSVHIPANVTSIGEDTFYGCESLTGIWVDENNAYYSSDASGVLFDKEKTTLLQAPGAISGNYTVPDGVTSIRYNAFWMCGNITGLSIPASVTSIGSNAFGGSYGLVLTIRFGGDAPKIGWDSFYWASATAYYPAGNDTWTEDVMQDYGGTITWLPYYGILDGADSRVEVTEDKALSIRANGEISKFESVSMDGVTVDPSNYTVTEGSTIVTFHADYLKTLPVGEHIIEVYFTDGVATTTMKVVNPENLTVSCAASSSTGAAVSVTNSTGAEANLRVIIAAYDENGRMIACEMVTGQVDADGNVELSVAYSEEDGARTVRVFLLDGQNLKPLRANTLITVE